MKKFRSVANTDGLTVLKTAATMLAVIALGSLFWSVSLPVARAAAATPADMIQANLPQAMNLGSAPKADLLSAVCKAVKKYPKDAPQIVRTASEKRKEFTGDILGTAVGCLRKGKENPDCELVRLTLQEAIAVDGEHAANLTELLVKEAPNCIDSPEEGPDSAFASGPANINGAPGSTGGGAAVGNACLVCHNGQAVQVACSELDSYLNGHPGDTAGNCQATPVTNP
jgi:hypothetical protein